MQRTSDGQLGSWKLNLNKFEFYFSISFCKFKFFRVYHCILAIGRWHLKFIPMAQPKPLTFPFQFYFLGLRNPSNFLDWWNFQCVWWHYSEQQKREAKLNFMDTKPLTERPVHKSTTLPINVRLSGLELKPMHWHVEIYESLWLWSVKFLVLCVAYWLELGITKGWDFIWRCKHLRLKDCLSQGLRWDRSRETNLDFVQTPLN